MDAPPGHLPCPTLPVGWKARLDQLRTTALFAAPGAAPPATWSRIQLARVTASAQVEELQDLALGLEAYLRGCKASVGKPQAPKVAPQEIRALSTDLFTCQQLVHAGRLYLEDLPPFSCSGAPGDAEGTMETECTPPRGGEAAQGEEEGAPEALEGDLQAPAAEEARQGPSYAAVAAGVVAPGSVSSMARHMASLKEAHTVVAAKVTAMAQEMRALRAATAQAGETQRQTLKRQATALKEKQTRMQAYLTQLSEELDGLQGSQQGRQELRRSKRREAVDARRTVAADSPLPSEGEPEDLGSSSGTSGLKTPGVAREEDWMADTGRSPWLLRTSGTPRGNITRPLVFRAEEEADEPIGEPQRRPKRHPPAAKAGGKRERGSPASSSGPAKEASDVTSGPPQTPPMQPRGRGEHVPAPGPVAAAVRRQGDSKMAAGSGRGGALAETRAAGSDKMAASRLPPGSNNMAAGTGSVAAELANTKKMAAGTGSDAAKAPEASTLPAGPGNAKGTSPDSGKMAAGRGNKMQAAVPLGPTSAAVSAGGSAPPAHEVPPQPGRHRGGTIVEDARKGEEAQVPKSDVARDGW